MERFIIGAFGRQTGRTYRALEDAIKLNLEGRAVYLLLSNRQQFSYTKNLLEKICFDKGIPFAFQSIKFETIESLGKDQIDWKNSKLLGAHPNCVLIIDHQVYAEQFDFAISGFHKYDSSN